MNTQLLKTTWGWAGLCLVLGIITQTAWAQTVVKPDPPAGGDDPFARPVVTIVATDPEASEEGPDPGTFTLYRTGSTERSLTAYLTIGGSARNGSDYETIPTSVTFKAGAATAEIVVKPHDGTGIEVDETVVITIKPHSSYQVGAKNNAMVMLRDNDRPSSTKPTLTIESPTKGAVFTAPATVLIKAVAIDPKGYIHEVDFYAGNEKIGQSRIIFIIAPPDGTPVHHQFEWKNVPKGEYVLTVKAKTSAVEAVVSDPVPILVREVPELPLLTIAATDAVAAETSASGDATGVSANPGEFTLTRTGASEAELKVYFTVGGTAKSRDDYQALGEFILLPAGAKSVAVPVLPIDDALVEGTEVVELSLKANDAYRVGSPHSARITILDNDQPANKPPVVTLTSPESGAVFTAPADITLVARAEDPDGTVKKVEFYQSDQKIGEGTLGSGGAAQPWSRFVFVWKTVAAGDYVLRAKATDDDGATTTSTPVEIKVKAPVPEPLVVRDLPATYAPGLKLTVRLIADPSRQVSAYAVEDQPPAGWVVSDPSHQGIYDAATGKVKFGPFFDHASRTLTYVVTPPATEKGTKEFAGHASADGVSEVIAGDRLIEFSELRTHPADLNPTDNKITLDEVTAYAAAWKKGDRWPIDPNPIPMSYVTRAGSIWRAGEVYRYDPAAGAPPLCWVAGLGPSLAGLAEGSPASGAATTGSPFAPMGNSPTEGETGAVDSTVPPACVAGHPLVVTLRVKPWKEILTYAVEDQPPAGWAVAKINENGQFDAVNGKVKWIFFDNQPRRLVYEVVPAFDQGVPTPFRGTATFDSGLEIKEMTIPGHRISGPAGAEAFAGKVEGLKPGRGNPARLHLSGAPGQLYIIEASNDLQTWTPIGKVVGTGAPVEFDDGQTTPQDRRFYRIKAGPIGATLDQP